MSDAVDIVRHPRARRMRLSVDPATGRVRLTLPPQMPMRHGLAWVAEQQGWIERQRGALIPPTPFAPGEAIPFGDTTLEIVWRAGDARTPRREGDRLLCGGPAEGLDRRIERWLRREALAVLSAETAEFAARAGVTVTRVGIGDPRSRWGSCASSGAIRYSWRLILAPGFVRRATVAHEVAHRVHMHHGREFHAVAAAVLGSDPAPARAWLRANGTRLHRIGRHC